jgi:hypothetical protein
VLSARSLSLRAKTGHGALYAFHERAADELRSCFYSETVGIS